MGFKSIVLTTSALVLSTSVNAALILGQQMTVEYGVGPSTTSSLSTVHDSETFVVIDPGHEVGGNNQLHGVYESYGFVDVDASSIVMNGLNVGFGSSTTFNGYHFFDTLGMIDDFTSVSVTSNNGFIAQSRVTFDADNIWLNLGGLSVYGANGNFSLDFVTEPTSVVPVPAAAWLFGSGLLGLVGVARRKKA